MKDELWIGKDFEEIDCGLIDVLTQHLPGGTEEKHATLQNRWWPGRNSNRPPPEYEFKAIPLRQPA
jgi:hypothetical protein